MKASRWSSIVVDHEPPLHTRTLPLGKKHRVPYRPLPNRHWGNFGQVANVKPIHQPWPWHPTPHLRACTKKGQKTPIRDKLWSKIWLKKGRRELPSQGNIHPRNRETMRMPQGPSPPMPLPDRVATQDSTQQASSTGLHLSRSLCIKFFTAMQICCLSSVANANWLVEYGTSLNGMATILALERRQYGPYRQMSPLAKWGPQTKIHHN